MSRVLVIAASDSSGGAGIARDLETLGALGVRSALAITGITVQTDAEVRHVTPMEPALVAAQIAAARAAPIDVVKIGALLRAPIVEAVAAALAGLTAPIVLDPVLVATSGGALLDPPGVDALLRTLLPRAALLTPNLPELAVLSGLDAPPVAQAEQLLERGANAVLVKGGHRESAPTDLLVRPNTTPVFFEGVRVASTMRGTGCTLATCIATALAGGSTLEDACQRAKAFVVERLEARTQ